ncbi:MAG TPA: hypothetical protein VK171_09910 [Fimbriimonas sp.]|nr:hypothetical protein [Fimbriimonas sp.]
MTKTPSDTITLQTEFRPKLTAKPPAESLSKSAVVQYFIGAYLGTRNGLGYGYPTHKYAQGFDWIAKVEDDQLTVTRTVSCLDRSAAETTLRDLHGEHDRVVSKIRSLSVTIGEFERVIEQTESRLTVADEQEMKSLKANLDQYDEVRDQHVGWRTAAEDELKEILIKMRDVASKGHADPVSITIDLGEYV